MSSYRQHLYHLVFRTKDSLPTIRQDHVNDLYAYITGIIKHKKSHMYRINGVENHLHILTDINPSLAPIDFMRDVKVSSSLWIKCSNLFPSFRGWAIGYGSFTCSYKDMDRLLVVVSSPADAGGYSYLATSWQREFKKKPLEQTNQFGAQNFSESR
jgi:putative transposase